jgi:hypothetical protein
MTEQVVTNELMYELLKRVHKDIYDLKIDMSGVKTEISNVRGAMVAMQSDIHNICFRLDRVETRLDRIENRVELRVLAEAQLKFDQTI